MQSQAVFLKDADCWTVDEMTFKDTQDFKNEASLLWPEPREKAYSRMEQNFEFFKTQIAKQENQCEI